MLQTGITDPVTETVFGRSGLSQCHLLGRAGTGKTYRLKALAEEAWKKGLKIRMCSFTNEIADQLGGFTIHQAIGAGVTNSGHTWLKDWFNPLEDLDVLMIDEYTLIDFRLWKMILQRQHGTKCRIVLCGDPYQLPPVRGKPYIPMNEHDTVELMKQYRNPEMVELIEYLVWHIKYDQVIDIPDLFKVCPHGMLKDFIGDGGAGFSNHPILLAYNNALFHRLDEQYPLLPKDNWNIAKCVKVQGVKLPIGRIIPRSEYCGFEKDVIPEWSLTVHKAQGRTFPGSPLVMLENILKAPSNLRNRLLYVALTRGTEMPTLCLDPYKKGK